MFGTLKNDQNNVIEFIEKENNFVDPSCRRPQHSACDKCRAKKIRCSGRTSGCVRCKTLSIPCTYSSLGRAKGTRKRTRTLDKPYSIDTDNPGPKEGSESSAAASVTNQASPVSNDDSNHAFNGFQMPENNGTCAMDGNLTPATSKMSTAAKTTPLPRPADHTPQSQQPKEFETESLQSLDENNLGDDLWLDSSNHEGQYIGSLDEAAEGANQNATVSQPEDPPRDMESLSHFVYDDRFRNLTSITSHELFRDLDPRTSPPLSSTDISGSAPVPSAQVSLSISAMELISPSTTPISTSLSDQTHQFQGVQNATDKFPLDTALKLPCKCLNIIVFLLDEIKARQKCRDAKSLETTLFSHKETLGFCFQMLQCAQCMSRPENIMMLGLVSKEMVDLCAEVVDCYQLMVQGGRYASTLDAQDMYFGDYELDQNECEALFRVLTTIQLSGLQGLLNKIVRVSSLAQREAQMAKLLASELRLVEISRKL